MDLFTLQEPFMRIVDDSNRSLIGIGILHFVRNDQDEIEAYVAGYAPKFEVEDNYGNDVRALLREKALTYDKSDAYLSIFEEMGNTDRLANFKDWLEDEQIEHRPVQVNLLVDLELDSETGHYNFTSETQTLWNVAKTSDDEILLLVNPSAEHLAEMQAVAAAL
ncbi:MAG: hypothetical protein LBT37_05920 [Lactobacillaceae bacterium]|jgi:hypothetical protein|nr:hypothetical protein [Lactobacillaceae bacterium]